MFKKSLFVTGFFLLLSYLSFSPVFALSWTDGHLSGPADYGIEFDEPVLVTSWRMTNHATGSCTGFVGGLYDASWSPIDVRGEDCFNDFSGPVSASGTEFNVSGGDNSMELDTVMLSGIVISDSAPFTVNFPAIVPPVGGGGFNAGVNTAVNGAVLGASTSATSTLAWIIPIAIVVLISITLVIWALRKFKAIAGLQARHDRTMRIWGDLGPRTD